MLRLLKNTKIAVAVLSMFINFTLYKQLHDLYLPPDPETTHTPATGLGFYGQPKEPCRYNTRYYGVCY